MKRDSRSHWQGERALEELMRDRIWRTTETIVEDEVDAVSAAARKQRVAAALTG